MNKIAKDVLPSLKHNEKIKALRVGLSGMVDSKASIHSEWRKHVRLEVVEAHCRLSIIHSNTSCVVFKAAFFMD